MIETKFDTYEFEDVTCDYEKYFSIDLPEVNSRQPKEIEECGEIEESDEIEKHSENEVAAAEQPPKKSKEVKKHNKSSAGTAAQSSTKRPASSDITGPNKPQAAGITKLAPRLPEDAAASSAQRTEETVARLEERMDATEETVDRVVGMENQIIEIQEGLNRLKAVDEGNEYQAVDDEAEEL
ncbi:hypothetical protein ACHAQJ_002025 [Trichoderma viride]